MGKSRLIGFVLMGLTCVSCSDAESRGGDKRVAGAIVTPDAPEEKLTPETAPPGIQAPSYSLTVTSSESDLRVKGTGVKECADITVQVNLNGEAAEGVSVAFVEVGQSPGAASGTLTPESATTSAEGLATSRYCSGKDENVVIIQARAGTVSANSGELSISSLPDYRFSWLPNGQTPYAQKQANPETIESDEEGEPSGAPVESSSPAPISVTLLGGGRDCTTLSFELTVNGIPVSGEVVRFRTQEDYPAGVKLALRDAPGVTETDESSGRVSAVADITSDDNGIFMVPLCSGRIAGTVIVSAEFTVGDEASVSVQSPLVVISGGLTNYAHMSLTYDGANARVISADTFTNTQVTVPFEARLGTYGDDSVIPGFPLGVLAEVGRVVVEGNGQPSANGEVKFSLESLNTRGLRPVAVDSSLPDLQYDSRTGYSACDPVLFPSSPIPYSQLALNWRSTLVYHIKGSEQFYTKDPLGAFDPSVAFGVWDVNQNGVYDGNGNNDSSIDKITRVPTGRTAASFDFFADDWFFDLPSPFVDANENGQYDEGEAFIGDSFVPPNGEYDERTTLWKSTVVPLYLGTTAYSLQHSAISSDFTTSGFAPSAGMESYNTWLRTTFAGSIYSTRIPFGTGSRLTIQNHLFGHGPSIQVPSSSGGYYTDVLFFHAHDKCGNPIPGGKAITSWYEVISPAILGVRATTTHFYPQPYDSLRESSKRLLRKSDGSSDTSLNPDVLEHPAAAAGYPVEIDVRVAPCENLCSGDLHPSVAGSAPRYCTEEVGRVWVGVEGEIAIAHPVFINEYFQDGYGGIVSSANKCGCANGAIQSGSSCSCPDGTALEGGATCVAPAQ